MTGSEVRKVLQENRINFAWLAKELGISPQGLNSRLLAKEFRQSYLLELNQVLGQPLFEVPTAINEYRLPVYQIQISAGYGMPPDIQLPEDHAQTRRQCHADDIRQFKWADMKKRDAPCTPLSLMIPACYSFGT